MSNLPERKNPSPRDATPKDTLPDPATAVEAEIDRQIGDLLPQKARREIVSRVTAVMISETFSGPIAHPRHLDQYERICPGAADRIIAMAEKRNDHHIEMERKVVEAEASDQRLGMISGAGLFALLIICALIVGLWTRDATMTAVFLGAAVVGGIGLFIKGRNGGS